MDTYEKKKFLEL